MRRRHLLLLLLASCSLPHAGTPPYALESLTFTGAGFRAVELDGYGTARGPHWPFRSQPPLVAEDVPEHYRLRGPPLAYVAGTRMEAQLVARVPAAWGGEVRVAGGEFAGTGVAGDGVLRARVYSDRPPRHVDRWRIAWTAEHAGRRVSLGTSLASLYVLRGEPSAPLLHTALALSVTEDAWAAFAARDVRRARDRRQLKYYGEYRDGAPAELRRMLVSGTGQCVAWAYLLHAALGAHGTAAELVEVLPPPGGMLYIAPWRFIDGRRFITAGANGVVETDAAGDDVAYITRGRGAPDGRSWAADPLPIGRLAGDDTLAYLVGRNGIAESYIDTTLALPLLARGFGLEMQRAYEVRGAVTTGGDDVVRSGFLLTGANGILETPPQPGMRALEPGTQPVQFALPRGWDTDVRSVRGRPHAVAIGAGANGELESAPGGDDERIDLHTFGAAYVSAFNMWPLRGARAQGNDWPPAAFPSHMLVRIDGEYYDPAYGTGPFASELEWERAHLAGVGAPLVRGQQVLRIAQQVVYAVQRPDGRTPLARYAPAEPGY